MIDIVGLRPSLKDINFKRLIPSAGRTTLVLLTFTTLVDAACTQPGRREATPTTTVGAAPFTQPPRPDLTITIPGERPLSLNDRILSFTWTDVENPKRLRQFADILADKYLELTRSSKVVKSDLVGSNFLSFHNSNEDYLRTIRAVEPDFRSSSDEWGFTHYPSKKVFINLFSLKSQVTEQARINRVDPHRFAGLAILSALWHEWGHRDVGPRTQGQLLNNPQIFFHSPISGSNEQIRSYRGGMALTDTYWGFITFDEVWNETINIRRMQESLGLQTRISAGHYYRNGTDFFPDLTRAMNIPLDTIYELHSNSDFEGFAILIGERLPGNGNPLTKGLALFRAIHQSDENLIRQTGALALLGR